MPLSAGTRLGYDVTALIGEGGMGQVWQATHRGSVDSKTMALVDDAPAAGGPPPCAENALLALSGMR